MQRTCKYFRPLQKEEIKKIITGTVLIRNERHIFWLEEEGEM